MPRTEMGIPATAIRGALVGSHVRSATMHVHDLRGVLALFASLVALAPLPAAALDSPPEVMAQQKINASEGGFMGTLGAIDAFGSAVAALGDLDGDGFQDLAVGAPKSSGPAGGAVWLLYLDADATVLSEVRLDATTAGLPLDSGDNFGDALAVLGDLDLDGDLELAVGAPNHGASLFAPGSVFVLSLTPAGGVAGWTQLAEGVNGVPGTGTVTGFGDALAPLGDLDANGVPDLAVTDSLDAAGTPAVWLLQMQSDATVLAATALTAADPAFGGQVLASDNFGVALASVPDVDGDGDGELAIGAHTTGSQDEGAAWLAFLQPGPGLSSALRIAPGESGFTGPIEDMAWFGRALAAGDLDGNAMPELVVGAPRTDNGGGTSVGEGAAWILHLDATGQVVAEERVAEGELGFAGPLADNDQFGWSLALLPDAGGWDQLAVGAIGDGGAFVFGPGAVWVLDLEASGPWTDLGSGLAGSAGVPLLAGIGPLTGNSLNSLDLTGTLPGGVCTLVVGLSLLNLPFKGGTLVPASFLLVAGLVADGGGALSLPFLWPSGVPSGVALYFQHWVADPAGPLGFAASNGLQAITP
ncbi:MAG: hypothetical protein FJ296_06830 [Planctomycetes bacterium]|nr:hypothetical protein [Planctomycetota bacterium]